MNGMFSDNLEFQPIAETFEKEPSILEKIAIAENGAIGECLDFYGGFIWAIVKKYTKSNDQAETAVREIFLDIWENAEKFDHEKIDEQSFIARIALRRLLKTNEQGKNYEQI